VTRQLNFRFLFVVTLLLFTLAACGGSNRPADLAAPLPPAAPAQPAATPTPQAAVVATPPPAVATVNTSPPVTATMAQPDPSAAMVNLNISGGIAGFCDSLQVKPSGEYTLQSCHAAAITGALAQADLDTLKKWGNTLAAFQATFQDNPKGPDNMTTDLTFNGVGNVQPDEQQKQAVFDWVNGLFIRLRPQAVAPPPSPTPTVVGPAGLCPAVNRPALVIADYSNPGALFLIDPASQAQCNVLLNPPPYGRVIAAAGNLYYPVLDSNAQTVTLWRLGPDGAQTPLPFTGVTLGQYDRFSFALSADGVKVAWGQTAINLEANPPTYRNSLWVASLDGANRVTLLDQVENTDKRFLEVARFSPDPSTLYYALQPDGLERPRYAFSGRYDTLYSIPVAGGQGQLMFACPAATNPLCIGDLSADGELLAYAQPQTGQVLVLNRAGATVATLTAPATDYIGPAIFGLTGKLAFVSATLTQPTNDKPPVPNPGIISLVEPPYTGQPLTLLSDNTVATLWEWVDESHLAYGALDEFSNVGTAIITTNGKVTPISPNYALAVLR
jgi:hypothetical protein